MVYLYKLLIATFLVLSFTSCGYSVDKLAEDHELRRDILKECAELGIDAKDEEKCEIAAKAEMEAAKNIFDKLAK